MKNSIPTAAPDMQFEVENKTNIGNRIISLFKIMLLVLLPLPILGSGYAIASPIESSTQATSNEADTGSSAKLRPSLEKLLEPTIAPLAGNTSTEPNELGQYTVYSTELKQQEVLNALKAGNYQPVAEYIAKLRTERTQNVNGMSIATELVNLLAEEAGIESSLRLWLKAEPKSQVAWLLYGSWCIEEAWRHRGSDWASTVSEEGWQGFHKYLTEAQGAFTEALNLDPEDYISAKEMITVKLGLSSHAIDRYEWFQRAISIYPEYYAAYANFQYTLRPRWGGSKWQMQSFATQNASVGPQFQLLMFNWIYQENDKAYQTEGSQIANRAWSIQETYSTAFPYSGDAYRNMAIMQMNFKKNQEAMQYAKKAVELDPSSRNRYIYGRTLHSLRHNEQSIAELKAALTLAPDNPLYWDWLGRNYYTAKTRNMPLAIECFTRAMELGSTSEWLPVNRGRGYMILGDLKAAIVDLEYTTKRWPNFDQAYYYLGTALYRDGNKEGAQQAFDRAIELNKKNKATVETFLKQQNK